MLRCNRRLLARICFLLFTSTSLWGQAARNWDVSLWTSVATGEENTNSFAEAQIFTAGFLVGRMLTGEIGNGWRLGRLEYAVDVAPVVIQLNPRSIYGVALDPLILRWNSSLHKGRIKPYLELGGGGVHTNANFPAGETSSFNFTARGGGGILVAAKGPHALDIGCRWWHISNANLGVRNPEFNGVQFSVGWHWFK